MDQIFEKLEFQKIKDRIKRYATSEMGKELIDSLSFDSDLKTIKYNLDLNLEFKSLLETDEPFPIEGIKDIREAIVRSAIENSFIQPKDFLDILDTIKASRNIKSYFSKRKIKYLLIFLMAEDLFSDKILEFNIEKAIDENGNVRDNASKDLRDIRQKIISLTSLLTKELDKILKKLSEQQFTQDDLITQRDGRFVIPIKVEHKRHIPGFIHSASSSGATVFIEPAETLEICNSRKNEK
jgi:DNA mismatch repair protein MutS2